MSIDQREKGGIDGDQRGKRRNRWRSKGEKEELMEIKGGKGGIDGDQRGKRRNRWRHTARWRWRDRDRGRKIEVEKIEIRERQRGRKKSEEFHSYLSCLCFSSAVCGQR